MWESIDKSKKLTRGDENGVKEDLITLIEDLDRHQYLDDDIKEGIRTETLRYLRSIDNGEITLNEIRLDKLENYCNELYESRNEKILIKNKKHFR